MGIKAMTGTIICAMSAACASVAPAPAERAHTARSGQQQVIGTYAFWNRDCQARKFSIEVTQAPKHGELIYADAKRVIPKRAAIGESHICAGKVVDGKRVFYQSTPGYIGPDEFGFRISSEAGGRAFVHRMTVVR